MEFRGVDGPHGGHIPTQHFTCSGYRPLSPDEIPALREPEHRWWDNFLDETRRAFELKRQLRSFDSDQGVLLPPHELEGPELQGLDREEHRPVELMVPPNPFFSWAAEQAYLTSLPAQEADESAALSAEEQAYPDSLPTYEEILGLSSSRPTVELESLVDVRSEKPGQEQERHWNGPYEPAYLPAMRKPYSKSPQSCQGAANVSPFKLIDGARPLPQPRKSLPDLVAHNDLDRARKFGTDAFRVVDPCGSKKGRALSASRPRYRSGGKYRR